MAPSLATAADIAEAKKKKGPQRNDGLLSSRVRSNKGDASVNNATTSATPVAAMPQPYFATTGNYYPALMGVPNHVHQQPYGEHQREEGERGGSRRPERLEGDAARLRAEIAQLQDILRSKNADLRRVEAKIERVMSEQAGHNVDATTSETSEVSGISEGHAATEKQKRPRPTEREEANATSTEPTKTAQAATEGSEPQAGEPKPAANVTTESSKEPPKKKRKRAPRCTDPKNKPKRVPHPTRKYVYQCIVEGCEKEADRAGLCGPHGANKYHEHYPKPAKRVCSVEWCTNRAVRNKLCGRHGISQPKKICHAEGCKNRAISRGVCRRHGAKTYSRKLCEVEGCDKVANVWHVCYEHGAKYHGKDCQKERCSNPAAGKHGLCFAHVMYKDYGDKCRVQGCKGIVTASKNGLCDEHEARQTKHNFSREKEQSKRPSDALERAAANRGLSERGRELAAQVMGSSP